MPQDTFYYGLEPRLAGRYRLTENLTAKASYSLMYQYLQLVASSGASLPTDIWYPSTTVVKPQRAQQVAGGLSWLLGDKYLITEEVYYKWLNNQIDYRNGAQLFLNDSLQGEFVYGSGWAYGNELLLEKKEGRLTGWIAYTLSWDMAPIR